MTKVFAARRCQLRAQFLCPSLKELEGIGLVRRQ